MSSHAFLVTANSKPKPSDMRLIIEAAGGTFLDKPPPSGAAVVVSTEGEKKAWAPLLKKHKALVATRPEHVLTCVLQQQWRLPAEERLTA